MSIVIDYSKWEGVKINELTFIRSLPKEKDRDRYVLLRCDCGVEKPALFDNFKRGKMKTCGCRRNRVLHGRQHKLFKVWIGIKQRCYNVNSTAYRFYGANGVTVCDAWLKDYGVFFDWCISNGWKEGLQIDKDIKGNGMIYSPETCIIVSAVTNLRNTKWVKLSEEKALFIRNSNIKSTELARMFDVNPSTIYGIKRGTSWKNIQIGKN